MARISEQLQRKKAACGGGTADPPAGRDRLTDVFTAMRAPGLQLPCKEAGFFVPYGARCHFCPLLRTPSPRTRVRPPGRARGSVQKPAEPSAGERRARGDVPDDRVGGRASNLPLEFFARVIWQESRFQLRCDRAGDAQRPARAGDCAVHAGNRERTRPARSLQSGAGVAEIGRVPGRVARPVRQSRAGGRSL